MRFKVCIVSLFVSIVLCLPTLAQVLLHGRVFGTREPETNEVMPFTAILCFASLDGSQAEPLQFRTWEMDPVGWYRMSGSPGNYTMLFDTPSLYMRPIMLTNVYMKPGDDVHRIVSPQFDYGIFQEREWDEQPAFEYYQTFVAKGQSVTQVGFKPVYDGIDGVGPGSQNLLISIHEKGEGTPDKWKQIGPTSVVLNVDCGGPKGYSYSTGWDSGEVPLEPGKTYAVRIRPEKPGNVFQMFWRTDSDVSSDCYRVGPDGAGWQGRDLWMAVSTDNDGLVIPYNKRVHKEFGEFAGMSAKWAQTYVARGRSLAAVMLYAAVSGAQPPLSRQRVRIRVLKGGPDGPQVGIEKVGIGNGNYTGDASWGCFGTVFAPGEVPLEPGETYAIQFESIENLKTLHGFVNIKGQVSDDIPGFNPYRKVAPDDYKLGTAYLNGNEKQEFDLDMQVLEYEACPTNWAQAVESENLLLNGDMESGKIEEGNAHPDSWKEFTLGKATVHKYMEDATDGGNRILRITGKPEGEKILDGGYVQRVTGLSHLETYRLSGRVRCTWPVDLDRQCMVGYDPTGQDNDPEAQTIIWTTLPSIHGIYVPYNSEPIRPKEDSISVWLRGFEKTPPQWPFEADFDDFALRRVITGIPK